MFYALNLHNEYGRLIGCDIDDERYSKNGGLKPQFKTPVPIGTDGRRNYGAIKYERPRGMIWKDANGRQVPDFINQFYLTCSARVKEIVEEMQDGITWTPFTMSYARGKRQETRYYFENLPKLDLLEPVASNMCWNEQTRTYRPAKDLVWAGEPLPPHARPEENAKLFFRADASTTLGLFNVTGLGGGVFLSLALFNAFLAHKITGLRPAPVPLSDGTVPVPDEPPVYESRAPSGAAPSAPRRFC